jgi:hypothetical protein
MPRGSLARRVLLLIDVVPRVDIFLVAFFVLLLLLLLVLLMIL